MLFQSFKQQKVNQRQYFIFFSTQFVAYPIFLNDFLRLKLYYEKR